MRLVWMERRLGLTFLFLLIHQHNIWVVLQPQTDPFLWISQFFSRSPQQSFFTSSVCCSLRIKLGHRHKTHTPPLLKRSKNLLSTVFDQTRQLVHQEECPLGPHYPSIWIFYQSLSFQSMLGSVIKIAQISSQFGQKEKRDKRQKSIYICIRSRAQYRNNLCLASIFKLHPK